MPELIAVSVEERGSVVIVDVSGEVDASNADELEQEVVGSVSNEHRGLVLDLTETRYLDSSAIQLIFRAAERFANRGQELRLVIEPDSFVSEVLEAVSAAERISIDATVAAALVALEGPGA